MLCCWKIILESLKNRLNRDREDIFYQLGYFWSDITKIPILTHLNEIEFLGSYGYFLSNLILATQSMTSTWFLSFHFFFSIYLVLYPGLARIFPHGPKMAACTSRVYTKVPKPLYTCRPAECISSLNHGTKVLNFILFGS